VSSHPQAVDLLQQVVAKLSAARAPVGYAALRRSLKSVSEDALRSALEAGLNSGRIFHWGDFGRSRQSYWHIGREQHLDQTIMSLCSKQARRSAEIKVRGFRAKEVQSRLGDLLVSGRLRKYPGLGREKEQIGASDQSYAAALREFVAAKLAKAGMEPAAFFGGAAPGSAPSAEMENRILEALRRLEPEPNLPVSVVRLRRHLQISDAGKQEFDRAVLELRDRKRVYLSRHDNPAGLSTEDRRALVDGGDGSHYVAVMVRSVD
jgi:hypothetical protein